MALSWLLLRTRFRAVQILGVAICLAGLGAIIGADATTHRHSDDGKGRLGCAGPRTWLHLLFVRLMLLVATGSCLCFALSAAKNAALGDALCIIGSFLYALSNVAQVGEETGCGVSRLCTPSITRNLFALKPHLLAGGTGEAV